MINSGVISSRLRLQRKVKLDWPERERCSWVLLDLLEVVEKTSPPAPVEILPSNAGQDIAPIQSAGEIQTPSHTAFLDNSSIFSSWSTHHKTLYRFIVTTTISLSLSRVSEVDECQINPYICGQGVCYNTDEGYTCHCDDGYVQNDGRTTCLGESPSPVS